jgi:beta-glucosidase
MPSLIFGMQIKSGRRLTNLAFALSSAIALCACSSMPHDLAPLFGKPAPRASAAPVATPAPLPLRGAPVDFATSTQVHPEIWPLNPPAPRDPALEAAVAKLLGQMTLEEKVGQLMQPDIGEATPDDVRKYHIGSILNGGDSGPNRDLRAPPQEWLKTADAYYDASVDVAPGRPVIPVIWGIDAMHGNGHIIGATLFPHNIGLGAMRDPDLVRRIGEITAQEVRVTGQDWTFAPTIAVVRDVRWGRTYESYSEDPSLVAEDAAAMIEGLQGTPGTADFLRNGHVLATAKHYLGDGGTDKGINEGDTLYSEPAMRDLFAPPYEAAIKAGVQIVMASYSSWRGHKMHGDRGLLDDVLFGRLGFDGFVVSDYKGFAQLPGCTDSHCPDSVNAGVDMFMTAEDWKKLYDNTLADVRSGKISGARLDEAVARILRVKLRAGVMSEGRPSARPYAGQWDLLGSPEHRDAARQAVRESLVLLKNDGAILPLSPHLHVLVAGDGADDMMKQTGGWTITWQGTGTTRADFPHATTVFEGIKANVEAAGGTATLSTDGSFDAKPDVAIVVFGENPYAEGKGDRSDVNFDTDDGRTLALMQKLRAQDIPVVGVFLSGRPLYVTPQINAANAFVAAWLPGSEGEGIADVLFRKPDGSVAYDFRGKLPFSWPRAPDQAPLNAGIEPYYPLFPFGYGLTYAAPRDIGALSEAQGTATALVDRGDIIEAGAAAPTWSVGVADAKGVQTKMELAPAVSRGGGLHIRVPRSGDPVLVARWSGKAPAGLAVSGAPADMSRLAESGMSLAISLRVDAAPTKSVTLAMRCGPRCRGSVDLTGSLRTAQGKGWTHIYIPLPCLRDAGAKLAAVSTPFELTTRGTLAVTLSSVKIARPPGHPGCPAPLAM